MWGTSDARLGCTERRAVQLCELRGAGSRAILRIVDQALAALSPEFEGLYAKFGRPSIPPERLLRALLLRAFYSVRSERQLMEELQYNLLFRWFVRLSLDDEIWDETVFTKNRERLIEGYIANKFMAAVLSQEAVKALLSDDHFSVDGTLIEAWASMKSFRPKDGSGEPPPPGRNGERDFHGEKRSNGTHASTTDPDARLYRKGSGQPAKLAYLGHVLMENRHALVVDTRLTLATGTAECYRDLVRVGDLFRRAKAVLRTRPIFHSCDAAIRGHVFCSFLHCCRKSA
jgi:transposase